MSLNYSLKNIKDWESVCYSESDELSPKTEALIFLTMSVGMGEITEKNGAEFWTRLKLIQELNGPFLTQVGAGDGSDLTVEDVIDHIGLHTNVVEETRLQWMKRYLGFEFEDNQKIFDKALEGRKEHV